MIFCTQKDCVKEIFNDEDGDRDNGDGWGWGQIFVPVQLSSLKRRLNAAGKCGRCRQTNYVRELLSHAVQAANTKPVVVMHRSGNFTSKFNGSISKFIFAFSALTLLVLRQEERPTCKIE